MERNGITNFIGWISKCQDRFQRTAYLKHLPYNLPSMQNLIKSKLFHSTLTTTLKKAQKPLGRRGVRCRLLGIRMMTSDVNTFPSNKAGNEPPQQVKKKKMRHSRQQKRENKALLESEKSSSTSQSNEQCDIDHRRHQQSLSLEDRIRTCARKAQPTLSTAFEPSHSNEIRIVTSCSLYESRRQFPPDPHSFETFRVQPLLVLDLNGILCHRSRSHREPPGVMLRPSLGNVAGTPIIPRGDLVDFLRRLDQYFCLAIWTSAKRKTARGLLNMLVPPAIQQKFLFVWTQSECHAVGKKANADNADVLFEKHLPKIWKAFPIWNADNTLLIDDSPDKCPIAVDNAVHPPPLHGQLKPPSSYDQDQTKSWTSDFQNEQYQYEFFQGLIHHWHVHAHERIIHRHPGLGDEDLMSNQALFEHLRRNGRGHMGWKGDHFQSSSW